MKQVGQIALVPFPFTNTTQTKLRPILMLRKASTHFDDWLVCMISSQLRQADPDLDEILTPDDPEFAATGLKTASVFRLSRLAVLDGGLLMGSMGAISEQRLQRLRQRIAAWITEGNQ